MKNKRGQFIAIYLVLLVLVMCAGVMYIYLMQQENVDSSLISPKVVFDMRNELEVYEMMEKKMIVDSLDEVSGGSVLEFRDAFFERFDSNEYMKNYFNDVTRVGDVEISGKVVIDRGFFDKIYPLDETFINGGVLKLKRISISKGGELELGKVSKVYFPMGFDFDFEREYSVGKVDGKYMVSYDDYANGKVFAIGEEEVGAAKKVIVSDAETPNVDVVVADVESIVDVPKAVETETLNEKYNHVIEVVIPDGVNSYFYFKWDFEKNILLVNGRVGRIFADSYTGWISASDFEKWKPYWDVTDNGMQSYERDFLKIILASTHPQDLFHNVDLFGNKRGMIAKTSLDYNYNVEW